MFDRFTLSAHKVMALSRKDAQRFRTGFIGTEHILLGLSRYPVWNPDLKIERVLEAISKYVSPRSKMVVMGQLPFTPRTKEVLELAREEADKLRHAHIGTGHLLLGLIRKHDSTAAQVLRDLNVDLGRLRSDTLKYLEAPEGEDQHAQDGTVTAVKAFPELAQLNTMISNRNVLTSWIIRILLLGIVAWVAYQCSSGP